MSLPEERAEESRAEDARERDEHDRRRQAWLAVLRGEEAPPRVKDETINDEEI